MKLNIGDMIIFQIFFALLFLIPILWGVHNWIKYKGHPGPRGMANYTTIINSAVLYALAFNLIFFLQELFLVLGKKALGLKAFLYHNSHNWEGEHPMISLMQGSGALAIFIIGLICLVLFKLIPKSKSIWKLFLLWLTFHGLLQSIPQLLIACLDTGTDVGEALVGYLNLSQPILIIIAIISTAATAMISIWFSRPLLEFAANNIDLSNPKARFKYIRFIAVGAGIVGSILIIPFRIPPASQAIAPFIIYALTIPWIWSASAVSKHARNIPNNINQKIYWWPIVCLLILLILFRLVLVPGVVF